MPMHARVFAMSCLVAAAMLPACHRGAQGVRAGEARAHHNHATVLHRGRLPEGVIPRLYDLALTLDPNAERFAGTVAIAVELSLIHI